MRTIASILSVLLLVSGCAPAMIAVDPGERLRLREQAEVRAIHYPPPSFFLVTKGMDRAGLFFGALGAVGAMSAARSAGEKLREAYSLQDPIIRVRDRFLSDLKPDLDLGTVGIVESPLDTDAPRTLRERFGDAVLFDFKTVGWGLGYHREDSSRYGVMHNVRARLIRLQGTKVLWQAQVLCSSLQKEAAANPTLGELKADEGAMLKAKLDEAADQCARYLAAHFLGKEPPQE